MTRCQEVLARMGVHGSSLTATVSRIAEILPVEQTHINPTILVADTSVSTDLAIHPSLRTACDTALHHSPKAYAQAHHSRMLAQLALHNPHIWANSLKPVCFLCFLLFWCPLLPFIETGTLKIYTKMVLYMKNEIFDLKYPLHGV